MSRKRKPDRQRTRHISGSRTNGIARSRTVDSEADGTEDLSVVRTKLLNRSCVFVGPEDAVSTFEVIHPEITERQNGGLLGQHANLIKGCSSQYALETNGALQLGTLAYYRKQGDSLIWDHLEGVIVGDRRSENRRDDPADLDAYKHTDVELSITHPLARALGGTTIKRLDVNESTRASLLLGKNCLIWCASMEPQTAMEWYLWRDSIAPHYDHTTYIGKPAAFARELAMMASSKRSLLGSTLDLRHPYTGHVERCGSVTVYFGPVVYMDDPRGYILEPDDNLELVIRRIFTKTTEHRHQREYRFAILTENNMEQDTLHLQVPSSMRQVLCVDHSDASEELHLTESTSASCALSPRLLQCFVSATTHSSADDSCELPQRTHMRPRLQFRGTHNLSRIARKRSMSEVQIVDYEAIELAIAAEPQAPDDSRISKITIDGGPGTATLICCLDGIWGRVGYQAVPNGAKFLFRPPHPEDTAVLLVSNAEFDGEFKLSHSDKQLILTVVTMNPAATVEIDQSCRNPALPPNHITLCAKQHTDVTVIATSEDGTRTSSFEIIIDQALSPANRDQAA